jgi:hypothetical protein
MQELMSRHKTTSFSPRDCLKTILHQRWSKTCSGTTDRCDLPRSRRKNCALLPTTSTPNSFEFHSEFPLSPSFPTTLPSQTVLVSGIQNYTLSLHCCSQRQSIADLCSSLPYASILFDLFISFRHSTAGKTTTKEEIHRDE